MSKAHRGRPLKDESGDVRGKCVVTGRSGVKLVYEQEIDGQKVLLSKAGKATLANAKKREARASKGSE